MARGDPHYGRVDVTWPMDPRCRKLGACSAKWVYMVLYLGAVETRRERLPAWFDIETITDRAAIDHRTCRKCLQICADKELIEIGEDGRITVHGVKDRHPALMWKDDDSDAPHLGPKRSPRDLVSYDRKRSVRTEDKSTSAKVPPQSESSFPSAESVHESDQQKKEPQKKRRAPVPMEQVEFVKRRWNELAVSPKVDLSAVRKLTNDRVEKIRIRIREDGFLESLPEVLKKVEASSFLSGRKPSKEYPNWRPTLFWLVGNSSRWVEILEGKYDDREREAEPDRPVRPYELKNR